MYPQLDDTGLTYRDLKWDPQRKTIASVFLKEGTNESVTNFQVTMVEARDIPLPANDVTVLSRKLRVSLYDESSTTEPFVSNIHTVTASWSNSKPKLWQFPSTVRMSFGLTGKRGVWSPRKRENVILVRSSRTNPQLSLIFELCVVFRRETPGKKVEYGEVSCGWCRVPIATRSQRERNREIELKGGKVFQDVPFDTPLSTSSGIFQKKAGPPTLVMKMSEVNRETASYMRYFSFDFHTENFQTRSLYLPQLVRWQCCIV